MHGFNLIYQFWIHTRFVKRLGRAELILNTPSHHRVHHGINDAYLDKNYAGVLIIWDRIFGTFVEENEEPRYGIVKQISGYNLFGSIPTLGSKWQRRSDHAAGYCQNSYAYLGRRTWKVVPILKQSPICGLIDHSVFQ